MGHSQEPEVGRVHAVHRAFVEVLSRLRMFVYAMPGREAQPPWVLDVPYATIRPGRA